MRRLPIVLALLASSCRSEQLVWQGRGPDRSLEVRVVERGALQEVRTAGRAQRGHRAIGVEAIAIAAGRVAYPVTDDGVTWSVVRDGVSVGSRWDAISDVVLSADAAHLAYGALRDGVWRVVTDEAPGPPFTAIQRGTLALGSDGRPIYSAWRESAVYVVVGDEPGPAWDAVRDLAVDGGVRYVATEGEAERAVFGVVASSPYGAITELLPDGFIGCTDGECAAVVRGERVAAGQLHALTIAGAHHAVAVRRAGRESVVEDGAIVAAGLDAVSSIALSRAGRRIGWIGARGGRRSVVVDGAERGTWRWARELSLSDDGGGFAFVASQGTGAVVVTQRGRRAFDAVVKDSLVLSEDGEHWGCVAGFASTRRVYVWLDGRPGPSFDLGEWTDAALGTVGQREDARRALLRRWVRAELLRRVAEGGPSASPRGGL